MAAATIWSECRIDILRVAAPAADEDECFWDDSFDVLTLDELFEGRWIAVPLPGLGGFWKILTVLDVTVPFWVLMVTISLDVLTLSNEDRLPLAPKCPLLCLLRDGSSLAMEPKEPYSSSSVSSTALTLVIEEVNVGLRSKFEFCFPPLILLLLLLVSAFLVEVVVAAVAIVVLLILGLLRIFPNNSSSNAC